MIRQTKSVWIGEIFLFLSLLITACFFIYAHFSKEYPKEMSAPEIQNVEVPIIFEEVDVEEFVRTADSTGIAYPVVFYKEAAPVQEKPDAAFMLYRSHASKSAVEWFYTHLTGDSEVTLAILEYADKNDIPFSLAFSLAYAESRYKATAVHKNENNSVDRGLFQLNSNSFPNLSEADYFNPRTSARYGMEHLRLCFDTAGNEVSALAMYNAGATKVRNDNTPRRTLNYIADILAYRDALDNLFQKKVAAFFPEE
jgi:soluble lytic murein transglycosylase-like protein/Na+-transporting methylmalonyl-CoA/oxaloacetate decarboxylase gamma subunit